MAWNVSAAVQYLIKHAASSSLHQCAKYVRLAIEAGGLSTAGRPVSACNYKDFLPKIGFNFLGKIKGKQNQLSWTKRSARPGDIAVMDHGVHGHICMYSGQKWISDFVQNNMWVYGGDGECYLYRYNGQIDGSLNGYYSPGTTGLRYIVPLDQQQDHILLNKLGLAKYNIVTEIIESLGNFGIPLNNNIKYANQLTSDDSSVSESIVETGLYWCDMGTNSEFSGAGAGKLPVPPGFYSDGVLFNFITSAEGNIGVQWVSTFKGNNIVRSAACFGYDFPGGVHDPSYIKLLGLTQSDADSLTITNKGRKPIGGEWYGGKVQWGWYTNPIPASHSYWQKLIPYYRDAMIWAWNQQIIQSVKDPGERLARMHSINWLGHHYLKGFSGGSGWPHRLKMAQQACAGMQRFS